MEDLNKANLSESEILDTVKKVYEERLKLQKDNLDGKYQRRIQDLETKVRELEKFRPQKRKNLFPDNWHQNIISNIHMVYYYLTAKINRPICRFCYEFKKQKHLAIIEEFWREINIPKTMFVFEYIPVDPIDRFMSSDLNKNYDDDNLSPEGDNWFYASGKFIDHFPAIEVFVELQPNYLKQLISSNRPFKRYDLRQGLGAENKETGIISFPFYYKYLIDFFKRYISIPENRILKDDGRISIHKNNPSINDSFRKEIK